MSTSLSRHLPAYSALLSEDYRADFEHTHADWLKLEPDDGVGFTVRHSDPRTREYLGTLVTGNLATHFGQFTHREKYDRETVIYGIDEADTGRFAGMGYLRILRKPEPKNEILKNIPHVGYTFTTPEQRGNAYGLRRLLALQNVAHQLGIGAIYSGRSVAPEANRHWITLIIARMARRNPESLKLLYSFVD